MSMILQNNNTPSPFPLPTLKDVSSTPTLLPLPPNLRSPFPPPYSLYTRPDQRADDTYPVMEHPKPNYLSISKYYDHLPKPDACLFRYKLYMLRSMSLNLKNKFVKL